jgi:hypothetical protein
MLNLAGRLDLPKKQIEEAIYQAARMHRGCMPGVIQALNNDGTVRVSPAITEATLDANGVRQDVALPDLDMVPLAVFGGGGLFITFPVSEGDECLLLFQDMCIDAAWQNGDVNNPQLHKRRHDLSDAVCVPLAWSQQTVLDDYSTDSLQIRNEAGTAIIEIKGGTITITAPTQVEVVAPAIAANASGGTAKFLMNADLLTWITGTLIPGLAAHSITIAPPAATVVTSVLKGQ